MQDNLNRIETPKARSQWDQLHRIVSSRADVHLIEPQPGLPDMPFTANAGFVLDGVAVVSRFRYVERRGEESHFDRWFRERSLRMLSGLLLDDHFEGAGDALLDRGARRIWFGHGHRSTHTASRFLQDSFGVEVVPLRLIDPRFYHLDTCFCPLNSGAAMYFPEAFDTESRGRIERALPPEMRIEVQEEDAVQFACNAVNIGQDIILNHASAHLQNRLAEHGLRTVQTELTEFMKAGGAAKCLTLRLNEAVEDVHAGVSSRPAFPETVRT